MGFLDNSGDIILDAVLTDAGRARLAKGDGTFRITKFALGDDEINYKLYDINSTDGSATYSAVILNTPIFESFTNNIASLNSRLISISKNNHLYLPVLKVNSKISNSNNYAIPQIVKDGYILCADEQTEKILNDKNLTYNAANVSSLGVLNGYSMNGGSDIRIDQGIDNNAINANITIDPDLKETQYLIEIDNRFGSIINKTDPNIRIQPSYIDDDDIAGYYFSLNDTSGLVQNNNSTEIDTGNQVIAGSRGTMINFKIKSSLEISTSQYLFDTLGLNVTDYYKINNAAAGNNIKTIMSNIRVTGLTTGYSIDIPLVIIKKIS